MAVVTIVPSFSQTRQLVLADTGENVSEACIGLHNAGVSGLVKVTWHNGLISSIFIAQGDFIGVQRNPQLVWLTGTVSADIHELI